MIYIRNDKPGIKKEEIERYIQGFVRDVISDYDFYPAIKEAVRDEIAEAFREQRYLYTPDGDLKR